MSEFNPDRVFNEQRDKYIECLKPIFLPEEPFKDDIIKYFSSLLRVLGAEDKGWDPYAESRTTVIDLNNLVKLKLPIDSFPDSEATTWRLGLLLYAHIVEMDAPYEVITNLLRFRLGKGYSPNPYYALLTDKEKKSYSKIGIRTGRKIQLIKKLSKEAGLEIGEIFDEFYNNRLRNAIQHSDFIIADDNFRSRSGISGKKAFQMTYEELDSLITKVKAFIAAVFQIETITRQIWGLQKGQGIPYDQHYKGLLEILVDDQDLLCGFVVHWPNNSKSMYRRTEKGVDMVNCIINPGQATIELFVDRYAQNPGEFSPLVEKDGEPSYTPLEGSQVRPKWPASLI